MTTKKTVLEKSYPAQAKYGKIEIKMKKKKKRKIV